MSEELDEVNKLLKSLGFQKMEDIPVESRILIQSFLKENNPVYLLGLIMKLMKSEEDAVITLNDYFGLKNDYIDFKNQTINTINKQTAIIQDQTELIEIIQMEQKEAMEYMETGKRSKDPTKH